MEKHIFGKKEELFLDFGLATAKDVPKLLAFFNQKGKCAETFGAFSQR